MMPLQEVEPKLGLKPTTPFLSAGKMTFELPHQYPFSITVRRGIGRGVTHTPICFCAQTESAHVDRYGDSTSAAGTSRVLGQVIWVSTLTSATRVTFRTVAA